MGMLFYKLLATSALLTTGSQAARSTNTVYERHKFAKGQLVKFNKNVYRAWCCAYWKEASLEECAGKDSELSFEWDGKMYLRKLASWDRRDFVDHSNLTSIYEYERELKRRAKPIDRMSDTIEPPPTCSCRRETPLMITNFGTTKAGENLYTVRMAWKWPTGRISFQDFNGVKESNLRDAAQFRDTAWKT